MLDVRICAHTHTHTHTNTQLLCTLGTVTDKVRDSRVRFIDDYMSVELFKFSPVGPNQFKLNSLKPAHLFYYHSGRAFTMNVPVVTRNISKSTEFSPFTNSRCHVALTDTSHGFQQPPAFFLSLPQRQCIPFQGSDP